MDNRDHRPIDLEELLSDPLEPAPPHPASDFSSWPAESSPAPGGDEGMEADGSEMVLSDEDFDDEGQSEEDYDGRDEDEEEEEESDPGEELEDAFLADGGEDDLGRDGGFGSDFEFEFEPWAAGEDSEEEMSDHQLSPAARENRQQIVDLISGYHGRLEDEDEGLFVDQGPGFLPPLEEILSNVRRNHARALDLVTELHSEVRNLGYGRAPRNLRNLRENHRHHPYAVPQDPDVERVGMNEHRGGSHLRDELVEVEVRPARAVGRNRPSPQAPPEVIDLTGDPDSPEEPRANGPPRGSAANGFQGHMPGRNPRRRLSLNQRTPSLSRSDGSLLGNQADVIDLTLDDSPAPAPALPQLPIPLPRRNNPGNPHHRHHHNQHRRRQPARAQPIELDHEEGISARFAGLFRRDFLSFDLIQRLGFGRPHDVEVQVIGGGRPNMDNPLGGNIPNLDYRVNGNGAAPKPDHVPPPPAREGFTRDTGNDDNVIICPSCETELKYDPDAGIDDSSRPAKKIRTRKDHEEHHFWALKDCGHVYCRNCYENRGVRKPTSKTPMTRFRRDPDSARKNLCAVDGCPSEVNNKSNWVGLFL
ncbi:hypothetical protein F5144DRAFT_272465 [Chaetomium tenue]|uniref:Uncharacterized protein n=1 Tax=Chaetomium tenue TaxID=1854479 RepID=A0ACB7P2L6_9PEZI|nr:hypothetical protein F5144DRAFT_272465 [Chaetomium globosum]